MKKTLIFRKVEPKKPKRCGKTVSYGSWDNSVILFSTSYSIDEAVGRNVGGFVMAKRRGAGGSQGGNGVKKNKRGGDYGCKADR